MATERFTLADFSKALPDSAEHIGLVNGEHCFRLEINPDRFVLIRSSIAFDELARETGEDSIRLTLIDKTGQPAGSRVDTYTTRVSGWEERVKSKIEFLQNVVSIAGNCPTCGKPNKVFKTTKPGPNLGRWFARCENHNYFNWIKLDEQPAPADEKAVAPKQEVKANLSAIRKLAQPNLAILNEWQKSAVTSFDGSFVMEAAPGSGKTRTIEMRVANMLACGVNPAKIGCFTFSVKGAEEMRTRIARTLWPDISDAEIEFFRNPFKNETDLDEDWSNQDPIRTFLVKWVCTIHALSYRLLKLYGMKLSVPSTRQEFEIQSIIKDGLSELEWDEAPKTVRTYIANAIVNLCFTRHEAQSYFDSLIVDGFNFPQSTADNMTELFWRYMTFMTRNNLIDYEMMQSKVVLLLRTEPVFRSLASSIFDYVIVDEAQDTSAEQFEILSALVRTSGNIIFVGDVDQSMYAFRGAVPEVMRSIFEQQFPKHTRLSLPINYRSSQSVVSAAKSLIKQNYIGIEHYLKEFGWRDTAPIGDAPEFQLLESFDDLKEEAVNLIKSHGMPQDWFVLSRTRAECAELHAACIAAGIPAINKSGGRLFGAPHVKKVLAYAALASNYKNARNDLEILKEVANVATRNFLAPITRRRHLETCQNDKPWINCGCPVVLAEGKSVTSTRYYGAASIEKAGSWFGIMQQTNERNKGGFLTMAAKGAFDLVSFVDHLEKLTDDARHCLTEIIEESVKPWLAHEEGITDDDLAENGKVEDFDMLLRMTRPDQSMIEYLDEIYNLSGKSEGGSEDEAVLIGTIHWSKGAERPLVLANLTRCPIQRPDIMDNHLPIGKPADIEEERRLAYVAITRAKENFYVLHSKEWNGKAASPTIFESDIWTQY